MIICWIISSVNLSIITINWLLQGYYIPADFNIIVTITIGIFNGRDFLDLFYPNYYSPFFYIKSAINGLIVQPLQLITSKEFNLTDPYFARKNKEIAWFFVRDAEVFIKILFFFLYTSLGFDIGNVNTYPFILLFAAETINCFLMIYVALRTITKSIGILKTFVITSDVSGFLLLFYTIDYFLVLILIFRFALICIGNKIISKDIPIGLLLKRSTINMLFHFNYLFGIMFAFQDKDGLFHENSKYVYIWQFINTSKNIELRVKLDVVKNVIAGKLIRDCQPLVISNDILEESLCKYASLLLKHSRLDKVCLITDILCKTKKSKLLFYTIYSSFIICEIITVLYPIFVLNTNTFLANYFEILYKISLIGLCITIKYCVPFIKFAYYSRFITKLPPHLLELDFTDTRRMTHILNSNIRVQNLCSLGKHLNILPAPIFSIITEYQKEENDVIDLICKKCLELDTDDE